MLSSLLAGNTTMKYRKTELGKKIFQDSNQKLSMGQRSALIMFDGDKDDSVVLKSLAAMGLTAQDIQSLVQGGLIEAAGESVQTAATTGTGTGTAAAAPGLQAESAMSEQDRYKQAYPVATRLTSGLGLRGFRLNLSVESAGSYQDLLALAPKIREAVGDAKFAELDKALKGL
jgi:hypothetical protein